LRPALNSVSRSIPETRRVLVRLVLPTVVASLFAIIPDRLEAAANQTDGAAGKNPGVTVGPVAVGFRWLYKVGEWTPLWVTIDSDDDRAVTVTVDAPDPDDNLAAFPGERVMLKAGANTRVEARFRTGKLSGDLQVRVVDDEG